jgi:cell division protein FtsB
MWNLFKLHQEKVQLQKEVDHLKVEIRSGRAEYQAFKNNPRVIEKQAREDLSLVKPGEMIYRFSKGPASR